MVASSGPPDDVASAAVALVVAAYAAVVADASVAFDVVASVAFAVATVAPGSVAVLATSWQHSLRSRLEILQIESIRNHSIQPETESFCEV